MHGEQRYFEQFVRVLVELTGKSGRGQAFIRSSDLFFRRESGGDMEGGNDTPQKRI